MTGDADANGWMLIATLPPDHLDGVLLFERCADGDIITVGWPSGAGEFLVEYAEPQGAMHPTHWQPRPRPPITTQKAA